MHATASRFGLILVAISCVGFVAATTRGHSHCGPCLGYCQPRDPAGPLQQESQPATVRFDEPPLARKLKQQLHSVIIPASFQTSAEPIPSRSAQRFAQIQDPF